MEELSNDDGAQSQMRDLLDHVSALVGNTQLGEGEY